MSYIIELVYDVCRYTKMPLDDEQSQKLEQAKKHSLANATYLQKLNALVEQLIKVLPDNINEEGLFRVAGTKRIITESLQEYWSDPNKKPLSDYTEGHSIHEKTGMLKHRVLQMTPGIVFSDAKVQKVFTEFRESLTTDEPKSMASMIQSLIDNQRMEEAKFFYNLMHMARLISNNSGVNQMKEMNMAIAFLGPNLMPIFDLLPETDDPAQQLQLGVLIAGFNSLVTTSLSQKEKGSESFYFDQSFAERYPEAALKCANDVLRTPAGKSAAIERPKQSDVTPDAPAASQPPPSMTSVSTKKTSSGWGVLKGIKSVARTIGDYVSQFDLVKRFQECYKLFLTDPKEYDPNILIGNPTLLQRTGKMLTDNDRILTINEENATIVLKDIEREMDKMFQQVGTYSVSELRQAQRRLEMIQKELGVIRDKIPAKDDHRVTPSVMNSAELVGVVRKALQKKAPSVQQHARQKLASEVAREAAKAAAKRGRVDTTDERKVRARKK